VIKEDEKKVEIPVIKEDEKEIIDL